MGFRSQFVNTYLIKGNSSRVLHVVDGTNVWSRGRSRFYKPNIDEFVDAS